MTSLEASFSGSRCSCFPLLSRGQLPSTSLLQLSHPDGKRMSTHEPRASHRSRAKKTCLKYVGTPPQHEYVTMMSLSKHGCQVTTYSHAPRSPASPPASGPAIKTSTSEQGSLYSGHEDPPSSTILRSMTEIREVLIPTRKNTALPCSLMWLQHMPNTIQLAAQSLLHELLARKKGIAPPPVPPCLPIIRPRCTR